MKISYKWIKEWIDINLPIDEVAEILTNTGLEVESIEKIEQIKGSLEGVFVAEVINCEKHPDADRLKVTTVSLGNNEKYQVVCGAPNVATGQKVLFAKIGTTLYTSDNKEIKLKLSKIRGVESQGMICAEDELGIGNSHEGILVLAKEAKIGQSAAEYLQLENDYQLEIGLTPNRADAMGIIGVARDLKAYLNTHYNKNIIIKKFDFENIEIEDKNNNLFSIEIEDTNKCMRYSGVLIKNIKVAESPQWLKNRLKTVGINPINNIVDITNYVMRELATPLHAFDFKSLSNKIVVKTAKESDKFVTLDGVERKLSSDDLMITNGKDYLAIAGVFGGLHSGITENTKDIFIESAYFSPLSVRKTAKRHTLNTDASFRFERGVDPELTIIALQRAIQLIKQLSGGEVEKKIIDIYPKKIEKQIISFKIENFHKITGIQIENEKIKKIIKELDINIINENEQILSLEVPQFRIDVTREIDVIEEILRIYGLNKIPVPDKISISTQNSFEAIKEHKTSEEISNILVTLGFYEILNNSLNSAEANLIFSEKEDEIIKLLNPLSNELNSLRTNLLDCSLQNIVHNQNRQQNDLKLFEWGNTYHLVNKKHVENKHLFLTLTGNIQKETWHEKPKKVDFYYTKGITNTILEKLGLYSHIVEEIINTKYTEQEILYKIKDKIIVKIGKVKTSIRKTYGIKNEVFYIDFNWKNIYNISKGNKVQYKEIPKTFSVRRDFSLLIDNKVLFKEIEQVARKTDKRILRNISLFDVYDGEKIEKGKKSYAVSFIFQDDNKTLKDNEVDSIMQKIRQGLENELGAQLR